MEPLKDIYSNQWIQFFAKCLHEVDNRIEPPLFRKMVLNQNWPEMELKERMDHLANTMLHFWDGPPKEVFPDILKIVENLCNKGVPDFNFQYIFLNELVSKIGMNEFEMSMQVISKLTIFSSAEFVIRHFYRDHFEPTVKQMYVWSKSKEPMVRRLSSEGSRPFLPWGIGIPNIKKTPNIHIGILETLWDDTNEIVRRSVANHLNDISKIDPNLTLSFCLQRLGKSKELDQSLKHALRTLLKKGNPKALAAFGYKKLVKFDELTMKIAKQNIKIGETLTFSISLKSKKNTQTKIRLEYKIGFRLASGKISYKIFQLGERYLDPQNAIELTKSHSFRPITTKTYYPGEHELILVANGEETISAKFILKK
jgi:3-methyladenine DNA glycosylase AlkC